MRKRNSYGKWIVLFLGLLWFAGVAANEYMRPQFKAGKKLIESVKSGDTKSVNDLLAHHASTMMRDSDGHSALWLAANKGNDEMVSGLLKSGADPNAIGHEGWSPLMAAAYNGHLSTVKILVTSGANAFSRDISNLTAADYAKDHPEIVSYLNSLKQSPSKSK